MNPLWLLRMKKWAKTPPTSGQVKFALAVLLACAILYGIDQIFGWPAWLTPNAIPRGGLLR